MTRPASSLIALLLIPAVAQAAPLTLDRVVLSASGVGQFDYAAEVDGPATLTMTVPFADVDDVLKSLRVVDPAGPVSVRLPGREPLSDTFRTLPFGQPALASEAALLGALVGAEVRLPSGATGHIVSVSDEPGVLPNNLGSVPRHRLTVATDSGLETAVLEEVANVGITSATLRGQIAEALAAVSAHGAQDRRELQVVLAGAGPRRVTVTDVLAVPVWKTSYRLVLGTDEHRLRVEGQAVVENLTGADWRDVDVTLTSGQPVLYRQQLYQALYAERPEAPVDVPSRATPRLDTGAVPLPPPAPAPAMEAPAPVMAMPRALSAAKAAIPGAPPASVEQTATQVNFHLPARVSAAAGQTLLLPILAQDVPAARVALYQPDVDPLHPLVALRLTNDTGAAWPGGLATLYGPEGFVGDARLPTVQAGEMRMVSFAVDLPVRITSTTDDDTTVVGATAARGVLTLSRRQRNTTEYRITTPAGSGRLVVLEQEQRPGWTIAEPAASQVEATSDHWRFTRTVPAGQTVTLKVVLQRTEAEEIALTGQSGEDLAALLSDGGLAPPQRQALQHVADLRAALDEARVAKKDGDEKIQAIVADQDRVRRNLGAVPANSELQRTYLGQLQTQERDLATLRAQQADTQQQVVAQERRLRDAIAGLSF